APPPLSTLSLHDALPIFPAGTRLRLGDTTIVVDDAGSTVAPPAAEAPVLPDLVGDSEAIREVARLIARLARVDSSVLIQGETGRSEEHTSELQSRRDIVC